MPQSKNNKLNLHVKIWHATTRKVKPHTEPLTVARGCFCWLTVREETGVTHRALAVCSLANWGLSSEKLYGPLSHFSPLYFPQWDQEVLHLFPRQRLQKQRGGWPSVASPEEVALSAWMPNSSAWSSRPLQPPEAARGNNWRKSRRTVPGPWSCCAGRRQSAAKIQKIWVTKPVTAYAASQQNGLSYRLRPDNPQGVISILLTLL